MKIVLQYFDGCPSWEIAHRRLVEVVGPQAEIAVQEIADAEEAERVGFRGSPTILVEGVDLFDGAAVGFACRRYGDNGAPSLEDLRRAFARREKGV